MLYRTQKESVSACGSHILILGEGEAGRSGPSRSGRHFLGFHESSVPRQNRAKLEPQRKMEKVKDDQYY